MKPAIKPLFALLCILFLQTAGAQTENTRQEHAVLRYVAEQFLRTQAIGLPGKVTIQVGQVDNRLQLAACAAPEAFTPPGSRVWGKTTVGVRCTVPAAWTVYLGATVQVVGEYLVTAVPLAQGQLIGPGDVATVKGDLTTLPPGIITDASQAVGRTVSMSLRPGAPLRQDALRTQQAVQQGQVVRLISGGPGFKVSAEARALANGLEGQIVQTRTPSGQIVSGVARAGGVAEVTY